VSGLDWHVGVDRTQQLSEDLKRHAIFYLASDLQLPEMFKPRKPLSLMARRAGWQGFHCDLVPVRDRFVRLG